MRREKWIFYFLFWTAVRAREEPLYKEIGDKVVLSPGYVEYHIYNIRWMYGNDVAMWYRYGGEPSFFRQFEDRGSLDISTGEMTITGLTRDDSGIYRAEINNRVTSETQLHVISPVPEPTISVSCDAEMTDCVYTCDGSTTGAEPVTYKHRITKGNNEWWFRCILENPVSSISSEEVFNLYMEFNPFMISDWTWIQILPTVLGGCLFVCIIIIICLICKCRKERAANRTKQERGIMLSDFQESSNMKPHVVGHGYSEGADLKPQWQYERESGGWWDFRETTGPPNGPSVTSDEVERCYQENPLHKMPFKVNEDEYELDFKEMIQTNLETETKRKVRRVMLPPECQDVGVSCSDSPL